MERSSLNHLRLFCSLRTRFREKGLPGFYEILPHCTINEYTIIKKGENTTHTNLVQYMNVQLQKRLTITLITLKRMHYIF